MAGTSFQPNSSQPFLDGPNILFDLVYPSVIKPLAVADPPFPTMTGLKRTWDEKCPESAAAVFASWNIFSSSSLLSQLHDRFPCGVTFVPPLWRGIFAVNWTIMALRLCMGDVWCSDVVVLVPSSTLPALRCCFFLNDVHAGSCYKTLIS